MSDDVNRPSDAGSVNRPSDAGSVNRPSDEELARMSREELVALGGRIDGVETIFKQDRWPVAGTRAEKRSERLVSLWLLFGGLMGLLLLLSLIHI